MISAKSLLFILEKLKDKEPYKEGDVLYVPYLDCEKKPREIEYVKIEAMKTPDGLEWVVAVIKQQPND